MDPIDEYADVLNSRDVIARIAELESKPGVRFLATMGDCAAWEHMDKFLDVDELEVMELASLWRLRDSSSYLSEWENGVVLIYEAHFTEYLQEEVSNLYGIDINTWPFTCIDWDQAESEAITDYEQIEWDGTTWYVHAI